MEHTGTMWVIFMNKKKGLLAKISSLRRFGKFMLEEWKVNYAKKMNGGWIFKTSDSESRTFSFHDGEVLIQKNQEYHTFRNFSGYVYMIPIVMLWIWLIGIIPWGVFSEPTSKPLPMVVTPELQSELPSEPPTPPAIQETKPVASVNPATHDIFLRAKSDFQYGRWTESFKAIKKNLSTFQEEDKRGALQILGEIYFMQCQGWMKQREERKAVLACEKSVATSNHLRAQVFLEDQDQKAKKLYLEAYTMQAIDRENAKIKYVQVLQTARTKSTWRGKAQYQLGKLKKQNV